LLPFPRHFDHPISIIVTLLVIAAAIPHARANTGKAYEEVLNETSAGAPH